MPRKAKQKAKDDDFFASSSSASDSPSPPPPTHRRARPRPEPTTTVPAASNTLKRTRIVVEPPDDEPPAVSWPPPRGNAAKGKARMMDGDGDATHPASKRRKLDPVDEPEDNSEYQHEIAPLQSSLRPTTPLHQEASLHIQSKHGSATRRTSPSPVAGSAKKHAPVPDPPIEPPKAHMATTEPKRATKPTTIKPPSTSQVKTTAFAAPPPVPGPSKARDVFDKDGEVKQPHIPRRVVGRVSSSSSSTSSPPARRPDPPTVDLVRLSLDRRAYRRSLRAKAKAPPADNVVVAKTKGKAADLTSKGTGRPSRPSGDERRVSLQPKYRSPSLTGTVTTTATTSTKTGMTRTSIATRSSPSTSSATHPVHAGLTRDQVKMMEYTFRALGVAYGVDAATVRDLHRVTMDIEKTVEILGVMGRAANQELQRALRGSEEDEEERVGGRAGQEDGGQEEEHGAEPERPSTPGSRARSQSQPNTASRRRRSSRHSLTYRIPSPTTEALLISQEPYSPPGKSRVGEFARLERQGRVEEAFERERRRVSGGVVKRREAEDGGKVVWGLDRSGERERDEDDGGEESPRDEDEDDGEEDDGEEENQPEDQGEEDESDGESDEDNGQYSHEDEQDQDEPSQRDIHRSPSWKSWRSGSEDEEVFERPKGGGKAKEAASESLHFNAPLNNDDDDHDSFDDMYIDEPIAPKTRRLKEDDAGAEADTESADEEHDEEGDREDFDEDADEGRSSSSSSSPPHPPRSSSAPCAQPYRLVRSCSRPSTPTPSDPSFPISFLDTPPKTKNGITPEQLDLCFERIRRNERPCTEDDESALVELLGEYRGLVDGLVRSACVEMESKSRAESRYWNPVVGKEGVPGGVWLGLETRKEKGEVKVKQEADERDGVWGDEGEARAKDVEAAEERLSAFLGGLDKDVVRLLTFAWMFDEASAD